MSELPSPLYSTHRGDLKGVEENSYTTDKVMHVIAVLVLCLRSEKYYLEKNETCSLNLKPALTIEQLIVLRFIVSGIVMLTIVWNGANIDFVN